MFHVRRTLAALIAATSLAHVAEASWLSDFTGIDVDVNEGTVEVGTPDPVGALERLPRQIEDLGRDMTTGGASIALAQAIRWSEARASQSARPMPAEVRADLAPFFPADVLSRVRYSTDWGATQNGTLQQFLLGNDHASAVTLGTTIVFADGRYVGDRALWAHELAHVLQYQNMGIDEFARQYVWDADGLEQQAYATEDRVAERLSRAQYQPQYQPQQQDYRPSWQQPLPVGGGQPAPSQLPSFCCTQAGRFGPFPNPGVSVGGSCYANTPWGVVYGQACY